MIKLKSLLFEQEEKQIHRLVSAWKNKKAQEYASVLIDKYGEPKVTGDEMLLWEDITLVDEENINTKLKRLTKCIL